MVLPRLLWVPPLLLAAALFAYLTAVVDRGCCGAAGERAGRAVVVAYSLRKRVELESERYPCPAVGRYRPGAAPADEGRLRRVAGTELYAAGATVDNRLEPYRFARIVAAVKGKWSEEVYCQMRSTNGSYYVMKPTFVPIWQTEWDPNDHYGYLNPVLVSCRIPSGIQLSSIALSREPCEMSPVKLPLMRKTKRKNNFTICVKPLNFLEDISKRLIQWIEINRVLGADRFHIFVGKIHRNVSKILKWYASKYPDTFAVKPFEPVALSKTFSNFSSYLWQKRRYEVVTYNSCFYENLSSRFVIPLDIDEIIIPKKTASWESLLEGLPDSYSNYIVRNAYYFTKVTSNDDAFFFESTKRSSLISEKTENCKSFISTSEALTVFNHYALKSLKGGSSKSYFLPFEDAQLNHYKSTCKSVILPKCKHFLSSPRVEDPVIVKYKGQFLENYSEVLNEIDNL